MKRLIFSQKGFTLVELIVVTLISTLLILVSAVGLSVFFGKYQELNAYVELQKDTMEFLNYLKNGYHVGSGSYIQFYGVTNADSLYLEGFTNESGKYNSITIIPPRNDNNQNDFMKFYAYGGGIRCNYTFNNTQVSSPVLMLPKANKVDEVKILAFKLSDANAYNALYPNTIGLGMRAINVELKAQVTTRNKKVYVVEYKTTMSLHVKS